ncbi:MAG: DUF1700 domain-containing protein [Clostridia bacterium]|nr:DUF1700 domain-containing protein [Clostridia bacterium]
MKYNEWRDELKNNLLSVSEAERRRVLDYYAEAYADRRDAGFSEREIIDDFGAPYDAAQRILTENPEPYYEERQKPAREKPREKERYSAPPPPPPAEPYEEPRRYAPKPEEAHESDTSWVFVLLCVIFAIPIFFVILGMTIATVSICVAPIATLISGVATIGAGIGGLFTDLASGAATIASGVMIFGVSLILFPICFGLVKLMWKLFKKFFSWLKGLFVKRRAKI